MPLRVHAENQAAAHQCDRFFFVRAECAAKFTAEFAANVGAHESLRQLEGLLAAHEVQSPYFLLQKSLADAGKGFFFFGFSVPVAALVRLLRRMSFFAQK